MRPYSLDPPKKYEYWIKNGHFAWLFFSDSCMPDSYELPNDVNSACDGGGKVLSRMFVS